MVAVCCNEIDCGVEDQFVNSASIYIPLVIKLMTLYTDLKKEKMMVPSISDLLEILIPTYQSSLVFELENCLKECFSTSPYSCAPTK